MGPNENQKQPPGWLIEQLAQEKERYIETRKMISKGCLWLARDRDESLHLFGTGWPPFFDMGVSQVSFKDSFAPYYGEIKQSDLNGIHIEPEIVIPVVLALPPANPEQA